jgi:hypothetical protein
MMAYYDAGSTKLDRNNSSDDSADDDNGLDCLDDFPNRVQLHSVILSMATLMKIRDLVK